MIKTENWRYLRKYLFKEEFISSPRAYKPYIVHSDLHGSTVRFVNDIDICHVIAIAA